MNERLTEGNDYYYNRDGLIVFTSAYHFKRGKCCGTGCMHCPYDYVNVPEPKRNELRKERPAVIFMKVTAADKQNSNEKDIRSAS